MGSTALISSAHESPATQALKVLANAGRSGRMTVGAGAGEISVWLLDGHVIATRAGDDSRHLIERFARSGQISPTRARQLQAMIGTQPQGARTTSDPIVALLADEVDTAIFDRALHERFHENVCRMLGTPATPVFEPDDPPWVENVLVGAGGADWIEHCALDFDLATALSDKRVLIAGGVAPQNASDRAALAVAGKGRTTVADVIAAMEMEGIAARVAIVRMIDRGVLVDAAERQGRGPGTWDGRSAGVGGGGGRALFDDDGFSGMADAHRGAGSSGAFVADVSDRVEITADESVDTGHEPIIREPNSLEPSFAAPSLSERDALTKLNVANEVLGHLSRAIDNTRGSGRGAASIQILVDARPRQFAPLLEGVKVSPAGTLPTKNMIVNVRRRQPAEQRRLLNECLLDLIERGLDRTADEIPDDAFDAVLEQVTGYRQRMGL